MSLGDRYPYRYRTGRNQRDVVRLGAILLCLIVLVVGCARPIDEDMPITLPSGTATLALAEGAAPTQVVVTPGPPVLRIDPSVVNLTVGETQAVQVWFDNPPQVGSIEVHLSFDPAYVRVADSAPEIEGVQVALGTVPQPSQVAQREVNNQTGVVRYQVAQDSGDAANASGCVTWFNVEALAEGGSPLRFTIVGLHGPDGETLPAPGQVDGLIIVGAGTGGAQPSEGAAATQPPAAQPTSASAPGQVIHTVQAGENLFRIAMQYGTTVEAIVEANHLSDAGSVQVGQELRIPVAAGAQGEQTYTVQAGDTLFSIARRFGMTVDELAALNGLTEPYTISIGQTLKVSR